MPNYSFFCHFCSCRTEKQLKLADFDEPQQCYECGNVLRRVISGANVICDLTPYMDGNIGHEPVYVKSKQHRAEILKDRGLAIL